MTTFGDRIRSLANVVGKEEQLIAKELGLTKSQLSHYINGRRKVPSELLQKIVEVYKINPQYLFDENAPLYVEKEVETFQYNFFPTAISAGLPFDVEALTKTEKINIPNNLMGKWAGNQDIFFTKIYGDSMNNVIPDGSLIAIKPTPLERLKDGEIVVFNNSHDYSVKQIYRQEDKLIFKPNSKNNVHHDQIFNINDNITINGKVVLYIVEMD
ncbi:S24 family peptidase [Ornithinibacillus sp. 4-3]|uniref:S24 family peptidase n=1 Tax=Ornithinibacillus sp. 4-3 TaxID=3231488 RepID=A0AB39HPZ2_9BACI